MMVLAGLGLNCPLTATAEEGVALAIVYDTSGSMAEPVRDTSGKMAPKHVIARRALAAIMIRLQSFATNAPAGTPRQMEAGLFAFSGDGARPIVPFGPFDGSNLKRWTNNIPKPSSGTPLGNALNTAANAVLQSKLARKHVLVITDGVNTVGPDPAAVWPQIKRRADKQQTPLAVHFVAFDVDAKVFNGVKKQGATVVGAADEVQLNSQLEFILEKKILLEDEEPPKKN